MEEVLANVPLVFPLCLCGVDLWFPGGTPCLRFPGTGLMRGGLVLCGSLG